MNCKKCQQELDDGSLICPACGEDNTPVQAPKKNWKPVVAVVLCVALIVGIAAAVFFTIGGGNTQLTAEEITVKKSYTADADAVAAAADAVVAKAGDIELTNGELQIIYWSMVYDFLDYYGDYVYYIFDYTAPLDSQYYNEDSGLTWQHYFLDLALQTWRRYEVLCVEAEKAGVALSDDLDTYLDTLYETIEASLADYDFDSVEDMLHYDFGDAATYEDYLHYMRIFYYGNQYYGELFENLGLTDDEIEAYYEENATDLISYGYGKSAGNIVDVRHILIQPSEDTSATDYTDAEWAACYDEAERILNLWLDGEATEDSFAELANTYSADSDGTDGGLYTGITSSTSFVEPFLTWCMDESRQVGDYGIIQTSYGYHIMYFSAGEALWYGASEYYLSNERMAEILNEQEAEYPLVVEYSKIQLGEVDFS